MTIEEIKNNGWLIFEVIAGSKAYGLDNEKSDTDIRGVFVWPKNLFYSLDYLPQVANETNDIVYYELKRFMELLSKNNPNIIELLNVPAKCILHKDALMDGIKPDMFLSKLCEKTFANYAFSQIKKAYGLEKKINNPVEPERKSVLDFCFVHVGKEAVQLAEWLAGQGFKQEEIGLSAIAHLRDCYNVYHSAEIKYTGIVRKENANDVCLSSIPKDEQPIGILYFNKDGYSVYCKQYKTYWEWVGKRNDERYKTTMNHGKNYDSKNMMHVFRLLRMAEEIAREGEINVFRNDKNYLLNIKDGKFDYDVLLSDANEMMTDLPVLFQQSKLKDEPDLNEINKLLVEMREEYYSR